MKITNHTDYALRTLIALGCVAPQKLTATQLSKSYDISLHHLLKVVQKLASFEYVQTSRGKSGGVQLLMAPDKIVLAAVVRNMETDLGVVECLRKGESPCSIEPACFLKSIFHEATEKFLSVLEGYTLADLLRNQPKLHKLLQLSTHPS